MLTLYGVFKFLDKEGYTTPRVISFSPSTILYVTYDPDGIWVKVKDCTLFFARASLEYEGKTNEKRYREWAGL